MIAALDTSENNAALAFADASNAASLEPTFEQAAAKVIGHMQEAFRAFLADVPGGVRKAADLQRAFDLDSKLAGQVFKVACASSPAAACVNVPPRVSLDRMLRAAGNRRMSHSVINRVLESYHGFERLVESEAGDRQELEAMMGAFLPEERARQDLAARQAVFKGMSHIKGVTAEAEHDTFFLHPSPDGQHIDRVGLIGLRGLRRLRADVRVQVGIGDHRRPAGPMPAASAQTLEDVPSEGALGTFLDEFSTKPLPGFVARAANDMMYYEVVGETVGLRAAADLVMADKRARIFRRFTAPGERRGMYGLAMLVAKPVRRTTLDVFLHREVCPHATPVLSAHDISQGGMVRHPNDPNREHDRLNVFEVVQPILGGVANARIAHVPKYIDMLEHVCAKVGWDPASFRGYRLDVEYPVFGAQYAMWFEIPVAPDVAGAG